MVGVEVGGMARNLDDDEESERPKFGNEHMPDSYTPYENPLKGANAKVVMNGWQRLWLVISVPWWLAAVGYMTWNWGQD